MSTPIVVFDGRDGLLYRVVNGTDGDDILHYTDEFYPIFTVDDPMLFHGRAGDDRIWGADGQDRIMGGLGNDYIQGGWGNDRLFGGLGNDVIRGFHILRANGGAGNDRIIDEASGDGSFDDGNATSFLNGGAGKDRFEVQLTWTDSPAADGAHFFDPAKPVHETAVIEDFHRGQGDHIKLTAWEELEPKDISARMVFNRLDTNHDGALNNTDGQSPFGEVRWDGDSLHLRQGQAEVDVLRVAQLTVQDFNFSTHDFLV